MLRWYNNAQGFESAYGVGRVTSFCRSPYCACRNKICYDTAAMSFYLYGCLVFVVSFVSFVVDGMVGNT